MNIKNIWLAKSEEKNLLKVVEWAHRQSLLIENLSHSNIIEALQSYLRDSSHS